MTFTFGLDRGSKKPIRLLLFLLKLLPTVHELHCNLKIKFLPSTIISSKMDLSFYLRYPRVIIKRGGECDIIDKLDQKPQNKCVYISRIHVSIVYELEGKSQIISEKQKSDFEV